MRQLPTLTRSAVVGVVATLVDLVALMLLVDVLGRAPEAANIPALLLGVSVQFAGNKWFAFRDRSKDLLRQGGKFVVIEAGALVLNALAFHLLIQLTVIPYPVARLVASALVYFGYSFPLWGRIFNNGRSA
jgi:putative flippase GtrA